MLKNSKRLLGLFMSTIMLSSVMAFSPISVAAAGVTIKSSVGWFETAHVEWSGSSNPVVEYKLSSDSAWTKVDSSLVRGTVVDIPGLKGNSTYNIRIDGTSTTTITTKTFTREGFAFDSRSTNKTTTGGYQSNGTAAANSQILYVTNSTKDSVKLDVVTNSKGATTACTGLGAIFTARQKGYDTTPLIIRIVGTVSSPSGVDSLSLLNVKSTKNVTIEGIGEDALLSAWGLNIRNSGNIEVRNLGFKDFPDDSVSIQTDNYNVWVHHNDFMIGANGGGDKAKGDGSCDVKDDSTWVTIDNNDFQNTGKSSLCGMTSETAGVGFVTYHHNWFNTSGSRHPRTRTITTHVYNNYFDHNYSAGVSACMNSSVFVENNYFCGVTKPMIIASQGNSIGSDGSDFCSGEDGGMIKAYGNTFNNCGETYTYINSKLASTTQKCSGVTNFNGGAKTIASGTAAAKYPDCYAATSRNEVVPSTFKAYKGGATYNNFDTASTMYSYKVESPEVAKSNVISYAGRFAANATVAPVETTTTTKETTTETTTKAATTTTKEASTETTTKAPASGSVKMGTYALNSAKIPSASCVVDNIAFEVRSVDSSSVKLRSDNSISFTVASKCTLELDPSGKGIIITSPSGSTTYDVGTVVATLNPGSYTITGAVSGSNTSLTNMIFKAVAETTTTETTTKATTTTTKATTTTTTTTTKATTTTTEKTTEATTAAPAGSFVAKGVYNLNSSTISDKICSVYGFDFNLRSVESTCVKLRSDNSITFTLSGNCTLKTSAEGKGIIVSTSNGSVTYNGSSSKSVTTEEGDVTLTLTAGTYVITGAASGSNTALSTITLS